jgi:hypothetical protein
MVAEIAKALNISYYVRKAKENRYLNEVILDKIKIYELTQIGKSILDQYTTSIGRTKKNTPRCRAENVRFKASVNTLATKNPDWHKVEMNNWVQYNSIVDDIKVHLNMGKDPTIGFIPSPVEGRKRKDAGFITAKECYSIESRIDRRVT